jgi:hypothetical protein
MTREIPMSKGYVALVDDRDYEMLSKYPWSADVRGRVVYAMTSGNLYMHRMVALPGPGEHVDHINHIGTDNRRRNLRVCTRTENARNNLLGARNKSGYKGVSWDGSRGLWRASIMGRTLGRFLSPLDAALAYDIAVVDRYGEFARPNFLQPCERSATR